MRRLPPLYWIAVAMLSLIGCSEPAKQAGIQVGLIIPGLDRRRGMELSAYQGLRLIRDSLGLPVSHVEARTPSDQDEALRAYAA